MNKTTRNAVPGFERWETRIRTTHRNWLLNRVRTHGAARKDYGIVQALDEVLTFAKEVLGAQPAPDKATRKQAKRATPVARKVNQPGDKPKANGKAKGGKQG